MPKPIKPLPKFKSTPAQIRNAANKATAPVYPPMEDGNASQDAQVIRKRGTSGVKV